MTGSSQFRCRRCFRTNSLSAWTSVSRVGPSIPSNPSQQTLPLRTSNAFVIVVITLAVTALVCLCTFILLCRRGASERGRPREEAEEEEDANAVVVPKTGVLGDDGEEAGKGGGKRRKGVDVELVVMAGEETPTFLAHPAPAEPAKAKVVECPPLQV